MFFNTKEDTNIDDELTENERTNKKKKLIFLIVPVIILLVAAIVIVTISSSNKPTIELLGTDTITITLGSEYYEPGYKAYDKKGNNLTEEVKVTNNINSSKEGEYEVSYSLNNVNITRKIIVIEAIDETNIKLNGDTIMYLIVGDKYTEPGYKVYDSIDTSTDLTSKVVVTGKVDTSKAGTYQIVYSVVNSRNVTTTIKRTIIVMEPNENK